MAEYYFDDLTVGDRFEFGSETVTKDEIIAFAERYDPQYFHLDEEAAESSVLGGLCASGWQTVCLTNKMFVENVFDSIQSQGGRGVDDLRWHKPVRPGDCLSGWMEVEELSPNDSDQSRGTVSLGVSVFDQDDEQVLSFVTHTIVTRRED